jgi:3-hydroxyacyl-[acyl-carrier protein] dehydratase/trans-2-decenoyl-[acyl-carrier protein] isomerase
VTAQLSYEAFRGRDHFSKDELLAFAYGRLVKDPPESFQARLPTPPMMMFERITQIEANKSRGRIIAECDVRLDDWFFHCHFNGDPVQPGCLGLDAVWQLLGFYCVWRGGPGSGRALGVGEVDFFGQIRPHDKLVRYEIEVRRYTELPKQGASMVVGNASVKVDDQEIYRIEKARVGTFTGITYSDYPLSSENAHGGRNDR